MSVSEKERVEVLTQYKDLSAKADLYYAFQFIHVRHFGQQGQRLAW